MGQFNLRSWDRFDEDGFTWLSGAPTSLTTPSWLIRFLHSFPHFKRDFSQANSTFKPESDEYRESVLILLAFPILWLLLTLLVFLIYFCVRCCQACCKKRNEEKTEDDETQGKGANCCRRFWLSVVVIVAVVSMAVGLFGNEEVSSGSRSMLVSVRQLGHRVLAAKAKIETTPQDAQDREDASTYINSVVEKLDGTRAVPRDERNQMKYLLNEVKKNMRTKHKEMAQLAQLLSNDISADRFMNTMRTLRNGEDLRWVATAAFFCWTIFILLLLIIGLARKSKCCLFIFAAFATITLVISWTVVSAYLGVAVGVADLCIDPKGFVRDYGGYVHEKNVNRFHFILNCSHASPNGDRYVKELRNVTAAIHSAKHKMADLQKRVSQYMNRNDRKQIRPLVDAIQQRLNLDAASARVISATALLECQINQHVLFDAVHGLCFNGINGTALVLLGSTVLGLCFTILILIASCSWRKFRNDNNYVSDADQENDPFLSGNYTTGPHYMSRRHHTESPEPVSHHHHGGGRSRHNKQTTVADVSVASSSGSTAAPRSAPAASNPTYSEHPMGASGPCGTPPLNSFSGSRTPPPPYGHSSNHHGSHHDSIYPSAPVL